MLFPLLGEAGGCSAWRGELEGAHNRRVEARLRDISQTDLQALSSEAPRSVEESLDTVRGRRAAPAVDAPQRLALTVDDLRVMTLQNNLDLDVVRLDPELAAAVVSEEAARFDALIFGGVTYARQNPPALDGDVVRFTADAKELDKQTVKLTRIEQTTEKLGMDVGIEVPLPTGGKVTVRNVFNDRAKREPRRFEEYTAGLEFSYSQPLLRNAGVAAATAPIRLARLDAQAATARTKLSAIRTLAGAEKAYWKLYGARKLLDIRKEQHNVALENLELVRRRVAEGLSAEIEIVRAEVGVASRLEALIMAETALRIAQRELKRILNLPEVSLNSATTLELTSSPQLVGVTPDADALAEAALAQRMELLELEIRLAADAVRVDLARNRALPNFVLEFEYGLMDRAGSLGSSWQGMWDFDNTELAVGLRGEIPVTNNAREAQVQRALLTRAQRLATRAQREQAIRQEVFDAVDVLAQNWQRILAARFNVVVSGVNYGAERRQFEEGLRTMREVLEALTQLGDAQVREVQAIVAYQVAQIDLAYATGTLLGYAGFDLSPVPLAAEEAVRDAREKSAAVGESRAADYSSSGQSATSS